MPIPCCPMPSLPDRAAHSLIAKPPVEDEEGTPEMSLPNDLRALTAMQAVRLIHDGKLRPEDLTEAYLARIAEREPLIQAFAHFDAEYARKSAATARPGSLQGLPIGLKDVLDTADIPSQYGSPIWAGWQPKADSAPLAWARAAGGGV